MVVSARHRVLSPTSQARALAAQHKGGSLGSNANPKSSPSPRNRALSPVAKLTPTRMEMKSSNVTNVSHNMTSQLEQISDEKKALVSQITKHKKTLENNAKKKDTLSLREHNIMVHHQQIVERLQKQTDENKKMETTLAGIIRDNAQMKQLVTRLKADYANLQKAYDEERQGMEQDSDTLQEIRRNLRTQSKDNFNLNAKLRSAHTTHTHLWDRYKDLERRTSALGGVIHDTVDGPNERHHASTSKLTT